MGFGQNIGMICGVGIRFPIIFGIARAKDTSVADNMEILDGSTQWNVSFVREGHD
jgi:hypothetical protein